MKRALWIFAATVLALYVLVIGVLYFVQERLIFFPQKLDRDHRFAFDQPFEEKFIRMNDGILLHGVLFRAKPSKGLIFYLHGNAGSMESWGTIAKAYTDLDYDLFILDYRGFGKSEGRIKGEAQLHSDVQAVFDSVKSRYEPGSVIIMGYSIGTGPAARLASANEARLLILQAPYYNLADLMTNLYPIVPGFILKYRLETDKYIRACKMPVVIFHGDRDEVINHRSSVRLKALFKPTDTLITLRGQHHNGMNENREYLRALKQIVP